MSSSTIKQSAIKPATSKPKRVAGDTTTEKVRKPRRKKDTTEFAEPDTISSTSSDIPANVTNQDASITTDDAKSMSSRRARKEKPSAVNDLEKRIKSLKKRAATNSVSIDRRYVANQTENNQINEELSFDREVDIDFEKMYEYKEYVVNYERLRRLPTFDIVFKTAIVDEDTTVSKPRGRTKKERILAVASSSKLNDDDEESKSDIGIVVEDIENDSDWKQELRTMVVRNRIIRIDDDKGLVYNSEYELLGTVEEFEDMDDDEPEANENEQAEE
jgi:hypothetical protein